MAEPRSAPLDTASARDVVDAVVDAQVAAVHAVREVAGEVAAAVAVVAGRLASGGRLLVVADGTAARVAWLATSGLAGEFGFAGAAFRTAVPDGLADLRPTARDAVVVLDLDGAAGARTAGAAAAAARAGLVVVTTVGGAQWPADVVVAPALAPEVVSGVTRLAGATAAKLVLDALTTAVVAQLGHVHDHLPVDLDVHDEADRDRAVGMVAEVTGADPAAARSAAEAAGYDVRAAVLAVAGGLSPAEAAMLASTHRTLRDALADLPRPSR